MPRFAFGKRKSTASSDNDLAPPSFRVLDRSEVVAEANGKSFHGGANLSAKRQTLPRATVSDISLVEDNIFAEYKPNYRGSGSSNTTKTNSTDNSSHHSNASTAPSSADLSAQEDWRLAKKRDSNTPNHSSKPSSSSFLKSAGRSWSFGGPKKQLPSVPAGEEDTPITPPVPVQYRGGRARATTTSTDATVTPPQLDQDIGFDLGSSFGKMFSGFDKRSSAMALKDESGRQALQPAPATAARLNNAPSPIHVDRKTNIDAPPHSWASHHSRGLSQHSNDHLLASPTEENSPPPAPREPPPPVPRHGETRPQGPIQSNSDNILKRTSAMFSGRRKSDGKALDTAAEEEDDLDTAFMAVSRYMSDVNSRSPTPTEVLGGGYKRNEESSGPGYKVVTSDVRTSKFGSPDDDNLFDTVPLNTEKFNTPRQPPPGQNGSQTTHKVMTTSEFEKYRKHKEVENRRAEVERAREQTTSDDDDEDEINYDEDEDEIEKSKQVAKQRKKQEAHMSVYRQQMMKVTGASQDAPPQRPSMQISFSSPNLSVPESSKRLSSDISEDDEEVPLAILAAHGFPNKNRPPTRLTNMMSNPNLRQAAQPSYQRPGSAIGQSTGGPLPPFARGLPQDPYGLVNAPPRESFALGGGVPAGQPSPLPPGGLVGVIASEERSRALRRGSPQVSQMDFQQGMSGMGPGSFDPINGIPPQMMYPPSMPMVSPGEQAQIQLNQQMAQFMQMQMQFMQMMASNNNPGNGPPRSAGHVGSNSMSSAQGMGGMGMGMGMPMGMGMDADPGVRSNSFLQPPSLDPRGEMHGRTMSMVQPSSASWLQPPQPGYAGSIRAQGNGYAPSIAPSERSNVGLPGRYRPVSHVPTASVPTPDHNRTSTMSGAQRPYSEAQTLRPVERSPGKKSSMTSSSTRNVEPDEDDEEGWAAMKAKRDQRKSTWRIRKTLATGELDIGSLIT
ncbi:hypothetical protein VSDG_04559 [Cytospora chrysosperma]|uniref:Uncharacterized protein n=1 Tax=Cytospora chrysosperma TaxID=252740 RepID=A0A423W2P1_CYTCH|nr:hypothetical protein VSDG_04559 [Valsa sordida]